MAQIPVANLSAVPTPTGRRDHLITILGSAGTGKTSLVAALQAELGRMHEKSSPLHSKAKQTQSEAQRSVFEGFFGVKCSAIARTPSSNVVLADAPSNYEDLNETMTWASLSDLTLVVIDANPEHLNRVAPFLNILSELGKPHAIFVNKIDLPEANIDSLVSILGQMSAEKLLVQQYPLVTGNKVKGLVHLWNEEVCQFTETGEKVAELSSSDLLNAAVARQKYLENIADYDDLIFAELLEERLPSVQAIADDLRENFASDSFVPIFFGSAKNAQGIKHLTEFVELALEKEPIVIHHNKSASDQPDQTSKKDANHVEMVCLQNGTIRKRGQATAFRLVSGQLTAGATVCGRRFGSVFKNNGGVNELYELSNTTSGDDDGSSVNQPGEAGTDRCSLGPGSVFYALKVDPAPAGTLLTQNSKETRLAECIHLKNKILGELQNPVYQQAIRCADSTPAEKLIEALDTLGRENELFHLAKAVAPTQASVAGNRMERCSQIVVDFLGTRHSETLKQILLQRFGMSAELVSPPIPYRERLSHKFERVHGRYKHQNGGHGAFGDVYFDFEPLPTGSGVQFEERITGGTVPKQYFAAIEQAVSEALRAGKQGFEVDDIQATLVDGSYHSVDSSELAFRNATRLAVSQLLELCETIVLEPYLQVTVQTPEALISQVVQTVPGHRGHIQELRTDGRFLMWSAVRVHLPQAELPSFVRKLLALCQGSVFVKADPMVPAERYRPIVKR